MGKLFVTEYLTLDGVMEDPGGGEKFTHGGWSFKFWDAEAAKYKFDELFATGAILLGRRTYEGFAKAWPSVKDEAGFGDRMNNLPKYVVTSTLRVLEWNNSTPINENIPDQIARLKEQADQPIMVAGSGELVQLLLQHKLVDEFRLLVHPIVLGSGKKLFKDGSPLTSFKLVETKNFSTGIVVLHYQPAE